MTAITTAARLLRVAADELKNAHTLGGDWGNEHEALDAYNEHMATATTLEHMARQCLQQIEEPAGAAPAAVAVPAEGHKLWAVFRQREDENDGKEFLHYALWHKDTILSAGERYVEGYFVPLNPATAPALEAPAAPAIGPKLERLMEYRKHYRTWGRQRSDATELAEVHPSHLLLVAEAMDELAAALAAAPQDQTDAQCVAAWRQKMQDEREGDAVVAMAFDAGRRAAAAPQAPAAPVHSKTYSDGTVATGSGELPAQSPQQQVLCTLLDTVEAMLGGANGPTIQIRAALLAAPAAPAVDAETIEDAERFRAMAKAALTDDEVFERALDQHPDMGGDATIDDVRAMFDAAIAAQAAAKGEHGNG